MACLLRFPWQLSKVAERDYLIVAFPFVSARNFPGDTLLGSRS